MVVPRVFSAEGVGPFDQVDWESRTAEIKDERGRVIFQQAGCEILPANRSYAAKLGRGAVLAPETRLAADFGVSRTTVRKALAELERRAIAQALAKHAGNVTYAAAELGITRTSLYRRMEKHGL